MTIEELKQAYEPEGVYAGMTQAEALRYLAKRYLRKPECVALCNDVANNLPALLKVAEAVDIDCLERAGWWMSAALEDPNACAECKQDFGAALDQIEALRKALEELEND